MADDRDKLMRSSEDLGLSLSNHDSAGRRAQKTLEPFKKTRLTFSKQARLLSTGSFAEQPWPERHWSVVGAGCDLRRRRGRGRSNLLILVLQLIELVINAAIGEQLLVGTDFAHLAFVHHDNFVGALNGG